MIDSYEQDTGHKIYCSAGFNDICICHDDTDTTRLAVQMCNQMLDSMNRRLQHAYTYYSTRRTVTVATRKHKARRRRRH